MASFELNEEIPYPLSAIVDRFAPCLVLHGMMSKPVPLSLPLTGPGKLLAEQKSGGKDLDPAELQAFDYLSTMPDHDLPQAIVVSDFATFTLIDLDNML